MILISVIGIIFSILANYLDASTKPILNLVVEMDDGNFTQSTNRSSSSHKKYYHNDNNKEDNFTTRLI